MTALERKQQTENILHSLGIVLVDDLPPIEEEDTIIVRSSREIAGRIMVLSYLNCVASNTELRPQVIDWLHEQSLWDEASPAEKILFHKEEFTDTEDIIIRSHTEAIWLLLWSINRVGNIGLPATEVSAQDIFTLLPQFMASPQDFFAAASVRPLNEIMDQADLLFRLNWAIRKDLEGDAGELMLDPRIAYERYQAINWVTGIRTAWDDDDDE